VDSLHDMAISAVNDMDNTVGYVNSHIGILLHQNDLCFCSESILVIAILLISFATLNVYFISIHFSLIECGFHYLFIFYFQVVPCHFKKRLNLFVDKWLPCVASRHGYVPGENRTCYIHQRTILEFLW
jgi:hypothetical protein